MPIYNSIYPVGESILVSKREEAVYRYQLLDQKVNSLSSADYSTITNVDHFLLTIKDEKCDLMGYDGKIIIENKSNYLWLSNEEYILVEKKGRLFYIDINGKEYKKG